MNNRNTPVLVLGRRSLPKMYASDMPGLFFVGVAGKPIVAKPVLVLYFYAIREARSQSLTRPQASPQARLEDTIQAIL
jgi:hypothetical protein